MKTFFQNGMLMMTAAVVCAASLGGCASTDSLMSLKAEPAWVKLNSDASNSTLVTNVIGGRLGESMGGYLDRQKASLDQAARDAATPNEALREMVEDVSSYLVESLPAHARLAGVDEYRLNLGMGKMVNRNDDPALHQTLTLIRNELVNNRQFTDQFRILSSSKERARDILEDLRSSTSNQALFDPDGSSGDMGSYNPRDLYIVEGEIYLSRESIERHRLTITTNVTTSHPYSGELIGSRVFSRTYHFHPAEQRFITDFENNNRP